MPTRARMLRMLCLGLTLSLAACSQAGQHNEVAPLALGPLIPTPSGTRMYRVPDSIPHDCSRDAAGELTRFLASLPSASTVLFPTGGCYAETSSIVLSDRSRLTVDGAGSTFEKTSPSVRGETGSQASPNWRIAGGGGITLQNMMIKGTYGHVPNSPNQFDHGVSIWGARSVALRNLSIASVDGDLITVDPDLRGGASLAAATPSRDIVIEGLRGLHSARQGVAFTSTIGALLTGSFIGDVQNGVDLEPDVAGEPVRDIRIEDNRFGKLAYTAVAAVPGDAPSVGNVTIARNHMTAPPDSCYPAILVGNDSTSASPLHKNAYVIRGNALLSRGDGILLNGVSSGAVTGNEIVAAGAGCSSLGSMPIRLVNSFITVSGNAGSRFR